MSVQTSDGRLVCVHRADTGRARSAKQNARRPHPLPPARPCTSRGATQKFFPEKHERSFG